MPNPNTTPTPTRAALIRAVLADTPTPVLLKGARAFAYAPRATWSPTAERPYGCFCCAAGLAVAEYIGEHWDGPISLLSSGYEDHNDWFRGEVARELAERGAVPEPSMAVEVARA